MRLLLIFLLLTGVCFGQSKKEQIESLNKSKDSLQLLVNSTRGKLKETINNHNIALSDVKKEVSDVKAGNRMVNANNSKLERENEKLKTDLAGLSKKNLELEAKMKAVEAEVVLPTEIEQEWDDLFSKACGEYFLDGEKSNDLLRLNKDGSFDWKDRGRLPVLNVGTWEIDNSSTLTLNCGPSFENGRTINTILEEETISLDYMVFIKSSKL